MASRKSDSKAGPSSYEPIIEFVSPLVAGAIGSRELTRTLGHRL